jgi:hypothetical protein
MTILVLSGAREPDAHLQRALRAYLSAQRTQLARVWHGGCQGIDLIAQEWCDDNGVQGVCYPYLGANGGSGGPKRNANMVFDALQMRDAARYPVRFAAFPSVHSRGTWDFCRAVLRHSESVGVVYANVRDNEYLGWTESSVYNDPSQLTRAALLIRQART